MLFCLSIALIGCNPHEIEAVPDELVGEWRTAATKFEGFTFEITPKTLIFDDSNADDGRAGYLISKIEKFYEGNKTLYTIHYRNEEGLKFIFAFYYDATDGGKITLKNQKKYPWKKINQRSSASNPAYQRDWIPDKPKIRPPDIVGPVIPIHFIGTSKH